MKKFSLLAFVFCFCILSQAQDAKFGLKGGLNISDLSNDQGGERGSRAGFHLGLLAHIHIAPSLAVQPEIMYSSQGAKYTVSDGEHNLSLNYVNIPFQLQYMFNNGFRLQTGPQLGFLASVKDTRRGETTDFFTTEDFKSVDLSWSVGLGYLGSSGLGIDGRYNFGISNINNAGSAVLHNDVFQLGLFYMLNGQHRAYRK